MRGQNTHVKTCCMFTFKGFVIALAHRLVALKNLFMALISGFAIELSLHINASNDRHHRTGHIKVIVSTPTHGRVAHSILRIPARFPNSYFDPWSTLEM